MQNQPAIKFIGDSLLRLVGNSKFDEFEVMTLFFPGANVAIAKSEISTLEKNFDLAMVQIQ